MNAPLSSSATIASAEPVLVKLRCSTIIVGDRLRKVLPDRVQTLRDDFAINGQQTPVDAVVTPEGPRLVFGAHRTAAAYVDETSDVLALLHPEGSFGTEAEIRRREIAENFQRFELNALERSVNIAEWRSIYEAENPPAKPGRKRKPPFTDEVLDELSANFALSFSEVAQRTLGISRRSVFLALKIASIPAELRELIAVLPLATNQQELLALAAETLERQRKIVAMLTSEPAVAATVTAALALLDGVTKSAPTAAHERISADFVRLKPADQNRFFDLHAEAIEQWLAGRRK